MTRPLQNRVLPDGTIVAAPERGTLMGNRGGQIHDPASQTLRRRRYASKQWICCVLAFKNRHREVMGQGYTELFFLDEVTALASGHRPCFECRRAAAQAYAKAMADGLGLPHPLKAGALDSRLHAERLNSGCVKLEADGGAGGADARWTAKTLPEGACLRQGQQIYAVKAGQLLPWSLAGYGKPQPLSALAAEAAGASVILTPHSSLKALAAGYRPLWHHSAAAAE